MTEKEFVARLIARGFRRPASYSPHAYLKRSDGTEVLHTSDAALVVGRSEWLPHREVLVILGIPLVDDLWSGGGGI